MTADKNTDTKRHEYRKRFGPRVGYTILGVFSVATESVFGFMVSLGTDQIFAGLAVAVFLLLGGASVIAYGIRTRVVIEGTRIEVTGPFRTRGADLIEIEGFRTVPTKNSFTQRIYLKGNGRTILVETELATDDYFRDWFKQIPDLTLQNQ